MEPIYLLTLLPPILAYIAARLLARYLQQRKHVKAHLIDRYFLPHVMGVATTLALLWFAVVAIWAANQGSAEIYFQLVFLPCAFALGEVIGSASFYIHTTSINSKNSKPRGSDEALVMNPAPPHRAARR